MRIGDRHSTADAYDVLVGRETFYLFTEPDTFFDVSAPNMGYTMHRGNYSPLDRPDDEVKEILDKIDSVGVDSVVSEMYLGDQWNFGGYDEPCDQCGDYGEESIRIIVTGRDSYSLSHSYGCYGGDFYSGDWDEIMRIVSEISDRCGYDVPQDELVSVREMYDGAVMDFAAVRSALSVE